MRVGLPWLCAAIAWAQAPVTVGAYQVSLRLPPEGLAAQEEMQIEYRVVDASRVDPVMGPAPIVRAAARSVIDMPAMPGMASIVENAHPEGVPGEYGVHPSFPHGGEYRLHLFITPPGAPEFAVAFPLQVQDAIAGKKKTKPRPFYAEVRATPKNPKAGEPVELELSVFSRAAGNARVKAFDTQHERPMHLIVVREDLGVFAHEHPELLPDGRFRLRYRFPSGGNYTLFVDTAPQGAGGQVLPLRMKVGGKGGERFVIGTEQVSGLAVSESVRMTFPAAPLPVGKTLRIDCRLQDTRTNAPVTDLQPYLGALGHLILVHEDAETFVHSHPAELDPDNGRDGRLTFLARFPKPGRYRAWTQIQRANRVETGAVTVVAGAQ